MRLKEKELKVILFRFSLPLNAQSIVSCVSDVLTLYTYINKVRVSSSFAVLYFY